MTFLLTAIGVVMCIGLALAGYLVPMIVGGVIGSFTGIAGFGNAMNGAIPGAIVGAVVAIAMKK